ncbi:hypothetical protein ONS95_005949 [Cadophora gregata]|uniref:uncharacterized protein n=1 Tax=Cadophora gregata TaxID=51156 RepID=UPI0026DB901D|nr:uncharacterized protein ONS95_005949 [Cadophora gregata]KAK0102326.1 hypothetical protein ONS95_005949 [Cadophora gregata]
MRCDMPISHPTRSPPGNSAYQLQLPAGPSAPREIRDSSNKNVPPAEPGILLTASGKAVEGTLHCDRQDRRGANKTQWTTTGMFCRDNGSAGDDQLLLKEMLAR